jgi:hypothetical protein
LIVDREGDGKGNADDADASKTDASLSSVDDALSGRTSSFLLYPTL